MEIKYESIGTIHTPYDEIAAMPIQPRGAYGVRGKITIFPRFIPALNDLEGFSHIYLIYHFHQVNGWQPLVTPFLDHHQHGLFATRAPKRPNPIGLSIVRLLGIKEGVLDIENVDILNGTPLLDLKPYVPDFDQFEVDSIGWLQTTSQHVNSTRSDHRFSSKDQPD